MCSTGTKREANTYLLPSPNDLFIYRSMAIWVHGDAAIRKQWRLIRIRFFVYFRFGTDQFNYYGYRCPLAQDWHNIP